MLKKMIFGLAICFTLASTLVPVSATETQTVNITEPSAGIQRDDVYEYKYTTIGGVLFKRLWNVTRGCWAEDYWTPA